MTQEERYRDVLSKRFNAQGSGVGDYAPVGPGVGSEALERAQLSSAQKQVERAPAEEVQQQAQGAPSGGGMGGAPAPGGSVLSTIGQAGMMSGNPYLMAAGLGVSVLAQGEANKRQEEEAQRVAYNDKIRARQEGMARIASMGIQ